MYFIYTSIFQVYLKYIPLSSFGGMGVSQKLKSILKVYFQSNLECTENIYFQSKHFE